MRNLKRITEIFKEGKGNGEEGREKERVCRFLSFLSPKMKGVLFETTSFSLIYFF